jgi:hypothetical protein
VSRTHYDVLGVAPDATFDDVRAAWRQRARQLHPDTGGDEVEMRAVNEAWHVLGNARRRAAYNMEIGYARVQYEIRDDGSDAWTDMVAAAAMAEDPPRASRPGDLLMLVPAGFFAVAILAFSLGVALGNASLLAVFLGALVLSAVGFVLAPFVSMTRARRR